MTFQKKCEECSKDFEAHKSNARYCSSTCRSRASVRRNLGAAPGGSQAPPTPETDHTSPDLQRTTIPTPPASDTASQFIISLLQKEADRFEAAYNKERELTRELRKKAEDLAEKIRQSELEKKINEAKAPEKSSLQGLMESPVMQGLLPYIGPVIQEASSSLVKRMNAAPAPGQVAGIDEKSPIGQFMTWLASKPQDVQTAVWEVLQGMAAVEDEIQLLHRLYQAKDTVLGQYMRAS